MGISLTFLFFGVLFLLSLGACLREAARGKFRRLWWYGGLLLFDALLVAGVYSGGGAAVGWKVAAFAVLIASLVIRLATPRTLR